MVQEPFDPLTPARRSQLAHGEAHTESIKREIERTRVVMSETIGEIQDRLRPDHLLQQAKDGVREAATGKVRNIMSSANERVHMAADRVREAGNHLTSYAKEHPVQVAITAGVITWLAMRGRGGRAQQWQGAIDTSWDYDEYVSIEPTLRDRASDISSTAREKIGDYAATARDTVNEYAATAASTARDASRRVRSAAGTATTSIDDWVHDNPLAAGAIAVAVGAAIGLAVPGTDVEDRAMGGTRDQAWAKARDVAANLKDNVTNRVQAVAEDVVGESLFGKPGATSPPMGHA